MGTIQSKKAVNKPQLKRRKRKRHLNSKTRMAIKVEIREIIGDSYVRKLGAPKQILSEPTSCGDFVQTKSNIRHGELSCSVHVPVQRKVENKREVDKKRSRKVDQKGETHSKREVNIKGEVHKKREVDIKEELHKQLQRDVKKKREFEIDNEVSETVHRRRGVDVNREVKKRREIHKKREVITKRDVVIKRDVDKTKLPRATLTWSHDSTNGTTELGLAAQPATNIQTKGDSTGDRAEIDVIAQPQKEDDYLQPQAQDIDDDNPHCSGLGDRHTCKELANEFHSKLMQGLFKFVKPSWQEIPEQTVNEEATKAFENSIFPSLLNFNQSLEQTCAITAENEGHSSSSINQTLNMYIGGMKKRPSAPYARSVISHSGTVVGKVGEGKRKDIRKAVKAAHKAAPGWVKCASHSRAQIVHSIAKSLELRREEDARQISIMTGRSMQEAKQEVDLAILRLFYWGTYADDYVANIQETTMYGCAVLSHEPVGVIGIACPDDYPLLGFVSLFAPAVIRANTVVIIPSEKYPLSVTNLYQIFDKSDLPDGVVNIVTGSRDHLTKYLVEHRNVNAVWYFGSSSGSKLVEQLSTVKTKRTWVNYGQERDWKDQKQGQGNEFFLHATETKNIWIPMTEIFANY